MRNEQLIRQWTLLSLLDNSTGRTQQSLAEELGTSVRTIQRDLQALTFAGFPITHDVRGHEYYWYLLPGFGKRGIPFTLTELLALSVSKNFYTLLPIAPLQRAYESAVKKVESVIPAAKNLAMLSTRSFGAKNYDSHWGKLQILTEAIRERKCVSLTYYSYGKKELSIRTAHPYDLWHSQETIYLIGYCRLRKDVRMFALERIQHVEPTEERFEIPADYSLDAFTADRFRVMQEDDTVTVRIRFAKGVADYVKDRLWHPTQRAEPQNDGSVILTFDAAGATEILHWVLGYGPNAEILEPQSLRDRAANAIRKMNDLYAKTMKRPARRAVKTAAQKKIRAHGKTTT